MSFLTVTEAREYVRDIYNEYPAYSTFYEKMKTIKALDGDPAIRGQKRKVNKAVIDNYYAIKNTLSVKKVAEDNGISYQKLINTCRCNCIRTKKVKGLPLHFLNKKERDDAIRISKEGN